MYFHVYFFNLQIHAHIYRSFIRHHKMLVFELQNGKTSLKSQQTLAAQSFAPASFFVNTLQESL